MVYPLSDIINRVAGDGLMDAVTKTQVIFHSEDDDLWVAVRRHKPDGTYTEAETFKYVFSADEPEPEAKPKAKGK